MSTTTPLGGEHTCRSAPLGSKRALTTMILLDSFLDTLQLSQAPAPAVLPTTTVTSTVATTTQTPPAVTITPTTHVTASTTNTVMGPPTTTTTTGAPTNTVTTTISTCKEVHVTCAYNQCIFGLIRRLTHLLLSRICMLSHALFERNQGTQQADFHCPASHLYHRSDLCHSDNVRVNLSLFRECTS